MALDLYCTECETYNETNHLKRHQSFQSYKGLPGVYSSSGDAIRGVLKLWKCDEGFTVRMWRERYARYMGYNKLSCSSQAQLHQAYQLTRSLKHLGGQAS